jgi:hypothetical protein
MGEHAPFAEAAVLAMGYHVETQRDAESLGLPCTAVKKPWHADEPRHRCVHVSGPNQDCRHATAKEVAGHVI